MLSGRALDDDDDALLNSSTFESSRMTTNIDIHHTMTNKM